MDRGVGTIRLGISGHQIPPNNVRPKVQKWVRFEGTLNAEQLQFAMNYNTLAQTDGFNYLGTNTVRYQTMRVLRVRAWLESAAPTPTNPAYGIILTDAVSGTDFQSRPVTGSSIAAVQMQLCLKTRENIMGTDDMEDIWTVSSDVILASPNQVLYVTDTLCEFS